MASRADCGDSGRTRRDTFGTLSPVRPAFALAVAPLVSAAIACALPEGSEFSGGRAAGDGAPSPEIEGGPGSGPPDGTAPDASAALEAGADAAAAYVAAVVADQPAAYFRFEEASSDNAARDSIGGLEAVAGGQVGFGAAGVVGHAVRLDGQTGFDLGDRFDFAGKVPFAFEAWIASVENKSDQWLIHKRDESTPGALRGYIIYLGGDHTAHFEGWGASLSAWTDAPLPTSFTHVVLSVAYASGVGNATLWINGQRAPNGGYDNTDNLPDTTVPLQLAPSLVGTVDELAIYAHDLPADRVHAHYVAGLAALGTSP